MRRRGMLAFGLLILLATLPAVAQESVQGFFEGPLGGNNAGSGVITVSGWVWAQSGIRRVVIQVDGIDIGQANHGLDRPDVEEARGFVETGFGFNLNSTDFTNGQHTISAKVQTLAGNTFVLSGTRRVHFTNNTAILVPFGRIDRPQAHAQLFGTCGENPPNLSLPRRYSVVEGFALDLGVEIGDTGVGWVELLVDGAIVADSRLGDVFPFPLALGACTFSPDAGGLSNCYGLPRTDIENLFPFAFDAPSAGYRFVLDVGALIDFGYPRGQHVLTIRAGDITGQLANIDEIPVTFFCAGDLGNEGSFGFIESPRAGRIYSGIIRFEGWALDGEGITDRLGNLPPGRVEILIDGLLVGQADYGVGSRASVRRQYPGFPDTGFPVWRFFYDSTQVADGLRKAEVFVRDITGNVNLIGRTDFFVDNERD